MQATSAPPKFPIPFANSAGPTFIRTIPQASQIGIQAGAASLTDGFPPVNFDPTDTDGIAPAGQDFNGILYWLSSCARWVQAGGVAGYDAVFSAAIGGYQNGAVLQSASGTHLWRSTVDNNVTNPDSGGAGWAVYSQVSSVFGRLGAVTAEAGDYSVDKVTGALGTAAFTGSNQSLAATGFQRLPGGLILQWGSAYIGDVITGANTAYSISFPISFPSACRNVTLQMGDTSGAVGAVFYQLASMTPYGATYLMNESSSNIQAATMFWFALGY